MDEKIFTEINRMKNSLYDRISNSMTNEENIAKSKKIYNELEIMLNIWTDSENMKTLSDKDKTDIFNTAKLIIKKADELL